MGLGAAKEHEAKCDVSDAAVMNVFRLLHMCSCLLAINESRNPPLKDPDSPKQTWLWVLQLLASTVQAMLKSRRCRQHAW